MKPDQPPPIAGVVRRGRPSDPGKHDAILENARRMFTRLGFDGTSMDELAQHAGVSKATIYNHFDSKEALFEATFERLLQALPPPAELIRSEEHTSELQSLMRISYAVFCLK